MYVFPWRVTNTVSQKGAKSHSAGLDDSTILHIKIKMTKIPLEKMFNITIP